MVLRPRGFQVSKTQYFDEKKKGFILTLQTFQFALGQAAVTKSSCPISTGFLFFLPQAAVGYEYEGKTEAHASQKGDS